MSVDLLIYSAAHLLTLASDVPKRGATQSELAMIRNSATVVAGSSRLTGPTR